MGHIVNAKSTRLGASTFWCDQWYSEKKYYSEFLHAMFRIRFYCYYIFTERHFDRKAIFLSHFELYRYFKSIFVEVFYYDGKWETEYEEYKIELFRQHYDMPMNKDPEMRRPYFLISALKFLVLFNWMFHIKRKKKIQVMIKSRFIRLFRLVRISKFSAYVKSFSKRRNKKFFYWNKVHLHFVLFLLMYVNAKIIIGKTSMWTIPSRNTILRRLYYIGGSKFEVEYWLICGSRFLGYIFEIITKFQKVYVHFYLTNNNCVNAKFLSRYIARKLQQGYPVKQLLNPIRKELAFLLALSSMPSMSYYTFCIRKYIHSKVKYEGSKSLYKILLSYIFVNYMKIRHYNFLKEKTFLNIDLLIIYTWLNSILLSLPESLITNHLLNEYRNTNNIILFGRDYFKKKIAYICFFENKFLFTNTKYLVYPKLSESYILNKSHKFLYFFNWIYNYVFVNKFCLTADHMIVSHYGFSLRGLGSNMARFFNYSYYNYNYKSGYQSLGINFLKSRIKIHTKGSNLIGYKMYLMGRFTRKQRAGHLWFSRGKTPLNTISAFIDFGFHSLSLKNSTITVKVWLYKSSDIDNRYYLRMY